MRELRKTLNTSRECALEDKVSGKQQRKINLKSYYLRQNQISNGNVVNNYGSINVLDVSDGHSNTYINMPCSNFRDLLRLLKSTSADSFLWFNFRCCCYCEEITATQWQWNCIQSRSSRNLQGDTGCPENFERKRRIAMVTNVGCHVRSFESNSERSVSRDR